MRSSTSCRINLLLTLALVAAGCASGPAAASEGERIAEVLALAPGMAVADVGAGEGEWSEELARQVGERGQVWATEVEDEIDGLRRNLERLELGNVTVVRGDDRDTGLPEGCCDAILLRMVYHHFTDPAAMRDSLARALRPGGRLAVIDIVPQSDWRELPGVPDRGGHGIRPEQLVLELVAEGFEVVSRHDRWNGDEDRYCVVFTRPEAAGKER